MKDFSWEKFKNEAFKEKLRDIQEAKAAQYPKTAEEILDKNMKFNVKTNKAMIEFKKTNPWDGTLKEIEEKILTLNANLSKIYGIEPPQIVFLKKTPFGPCYFPGSNLIMMEPEKNGKYAISTYLHEFGHALGKNEKETCKWSINLFKKHFPENFDKLDQKGHLLFVKKPEKLQDEVNIAEAKEKPVEKIQ